MQCSDDPFRWGTWPSHYLPPWGWRVACTADRRHVDPRLEKQATAWRALGGLVAAGPRGSPSAETDRFLQCFSCTVRTRGGPPRRSSSHAFSLSSDRMTLATTASHYLSSHSHVSSLSASAWVSQATAASSSFVGLHLAQSSHRSFFFY